MKHILTSAALILVSSQALAGGQVGGGSGGHPKSIETQLTGGGIGGGGLGLEGGTVGGVGPSIQVHGGSGSDVQALGGSGGGVSGLCLDGGTIGGSGTGRLLDLLFVLGGGTGGGSTPPAEC